MCAHYVKRLEAPVRTRCRIFGIEIYTQQYDSIVKFLQDKGYILHSNFSNYNKTTNPGWDGTHKDKPCNSGVYAYVCDVTYENGSTKKFTGNITLIR
jgi:hypothetical protein